MSKLHRCPFRQQSDLSTCPNCNGQGVVYNDTLTSCVQDNKTSYEEIVPYKPEVTGMALFSPKLSVDQIKSERSKRNANHFTKEVLPTLPKDDQRFHANLEGLKLGSDGKR